MTKYSELLGELEIISNNGTVIKAIVKKTGETKMLLAAMANLQDEPFKKEVKKAAEPTRKLTKEEELHLSFLNRNGNATAKLLLNSNKNYRSGKSGMSSLTK